MFTNSDGGGADIPMWDVYQDFLSSQVERIGEGTNEQDEKKLLTTMQ